MSTVCKNCRTVTTCMEMGCGQGSASPAAAVTVDALPEATTVMQLADEFGSGSTAYTAAQVREIVRAAVEADRAQRPLPVLPKVPRTYQQTEKERAAIEAYGQACIAADRAQQGEPVAASDEFWRERVAENAADVAAEHVDMSKMYDEFRRLKSILKTPGYCDGTKYTERQAFYMAIATKAAAPDARIEALARKLVEFYPDSLPNMYCDGKPIGRELVEACRAAPAPDTGIPNAGEVAQAMGAFADFDMVAAYNEWLEERGPLGVGSMSERIFFAGWLASRRAPVSSTPTPGAVKGPRKSRKILMDDGRMLNVTPTHPSEEDA